MSQLPGFSKYLKFSNVEVDQTFTESMQHLNAQSEDPENYTWLLGTIQMKSSREIDVNYPVEIGDTSALAKMKIQPSWGLHFQEQNAFYEERNMNPIDPAVEVEGQNIPAEVKGNEKYYFYHDQNYLDEAHHEKEAQFMKKSFLFKAAVPTLQQTLFHNARIDFVDSSLLRDISTEEAVQFGASYINLWNFTNSEGIRTPLHIMQSNRKALLELNDDSLNVPRELLLRNSSLRIYQDRLSHDYVYNSDADGVMFLGKMDVERFEIKPIEDSPDWNQNTIFTLSSYPIIPLVAIGGFDYEGTDTSSFVIVAPETIKGIGMETDNNSYLGLRNYSGVLDISNSPNIVEIYTQGFSSCENATLLVNNNQWTALENRIADGMLDNKIQIQKKSEVQA